METKAMLQNAKRIAGEVAALGTEVKNAALLEMADALLVHTEDILAANQKDMDAAKGIISDVMLDRLLLNEARIASMADGIRDVVALPDPVGRVIEETMPQEGLDIKKISVPIGVIAIIYESRPNVTADAAALTLKSGNVCVLRCGKEAHQSAAAIIQAMKEGLEKAGVNEAAINLVEDTSRESANELMTSPEYVDLLIPRGGAGLIRACVTNATVPCIETGTGICHVYVDKDADLEKAVKIINNAKTSRPSVCNAEEVLLVHKEVAGELLPRLKKVLVDERKESGWTFSDGYYFATQCMAARVDEEIKGFEDLKGETVGVKTGTQGASYAESLKDEYGFEITYFEDSPTMYLAVEGRQVEACFEDTPIMLTQIQDLDLSLEVVQGTENEGSPYGFAIFSDKSQELLDKFNAGLKNIIADGTYQEIVAKYLGEAAAESAVENLERGFTNETEAE